MSAMRFAACMVILGSTFLFTQAALAQSYPSKPVRIVTSQPGGTLDFTARILSQGLVESFKQPVIVENRPGIIGIDMVAKAAPDGYTLQLGSAAMWFAPFTQDNLGWDPVKDFSPIAVVVRSPNVLIVRPSLPVKTVKDLIALARAKPGTLNYASTSIGGSIHLAGQLFQSLAGIDIVRVPYKGEGAALTGLLAGELQLMFSTAGVSIPLIKAGKVRALAVTSAEPSALIPGLPTVASGGVPGYEIMSIIGMFAPAKTSPLIINRLNQEILRVIRKEDVKEKFLKVGVETVGSTAEELAATVKSEMARMGKLIKDARIRAAN